MTVRQKQNLLAYLGYYCGSIDGIWGKGSSGAAAAFQQDFGICVDGIAGTETEKALKEAVFRGMPQKTGETKDTFWETIRYWSREEFACRCGEYHSPYCNGFPVEPDRTLVELAEDIRASFGRPGHRTSGIRCAQHNLDSGGVSNSRHLQGKALDFWIEGVSGMTLLSRVLEDPRTRYAYIVEGNIVHMDVQ